MVALPAKLVKHFFGDKSRSTPAENEDILARAAEGDTIQCKASKITLSWRGSHLFIVVAGDDNDLLRVITFGDSFFDSGT